MGDLAAQHGADLMRRGFTVEQVVHDYGDLCQSITNLAFERSEPVEVDEFRTLNRCLDNAIAMAVTEFNYQRDFVEADKQERALNVQFGFFAHELRNFSKRGYPWRSLPSGKVTLGLYWSHRQRAGPCLGRHADPH